MGLKVPTISDIKREVNNAKENFQRSDIGRVTGNITNPVTSRIEAVKDIVKGDFDKAAGRIISSNLSRNLFSQAINSSSSAEELFQTKEANNLSFGLTGDSVKATNAYNEWQNTGKLSKEQLNDILVFNAKGAAMAYGSSYAYEAGYLDKAWAWITQNPGQAALTAKLASQGNYAGALTTVAPELGQYFPPPVQDRPVGFEPPQETSAAFDNFTVEAIDTKTKWALAIALFFIVALIFKKTRG